MSHRFHLRIRYSLLTLALCATPIVHADAVSDDVASLQHDWAIANYSTPDAQKEQAFHDLVGRAEQAVSRSPGRPEPMVWEAIILSSYAKAEGGLDALDRIKKARDLLFDAEKIDASTLDGSVYTSLGSLYAKAPGWPLSFGDRKKAKAYLEKALAINPDGIDPNFFYGELLAGNDVAGARAHLEKALAAPPRPGREDADAGRRAEAQAALARLSQS